MRTFLTLVFVVGTVLCRAQQVNTSPVHPAETVLTLEVFDYFPDALRTRFRSDDGERTEFIESLYRFRIIEPKEYRHKEMSVYLPRKIMGRLQAAMIGDKVSVHFDTKALEDFMASSIRLSSVENAVAAALQNKIQTEANQPLQTTAMTPPPSAKPLPF